MATVEENNHSVSVLFYDFLGYTSMHGAGRIVASRQWTRRIFWIISIMVALAVVSLQVQTLHRLYKNRPVSTHIAIAYELVMSESFPFYN